MTALAVSHAAIRSATDNERESKLLAYLTNAQQAALAARNATERFEVVRDIHALQAMAKAYVLSAAAARKLGEASILCLRLFGVALRAEYPGEDTENGRLRAKMTGASPGTCQNASVLAAYSEEAILAAFEALREYGAAPGFKSVYEQLRAQKGRKSAHKVQPSAQLESAMTGALIKSLRVTLSLGLRFMEAKRYTLADAQREYGISKRTFERSIARLRDAGMILDRPGDGEVHFVAIDTTLSGARVA